MNTKFASLIILISCLNCSSINEIKWRTLSSETFERAKKENKIILLNLEANWCHWCHVMHDSTYSNNEVAEYLNKHFISVKADQDANPELSIRYKEYGWPATIFINAKGEDVVKRAGYISPKLFLQLLKAIIKDPTPEENNKSLATISINQVENTALIDELKNNFEESLDYNVGGFDQSQKYVEWDTYEYALFNSKNQNIKEWIKKSVEGAKQLSDPAWGGIYQYSTDYDWQHLHFEKLLSIQARYIKIFAYNYLYSNDNLSLHYAEKIVDYTNRFLLHENGLYSNAQDADLKQGEHAEYYFSMNDKERLKLGIPKVDTNAYTNNNAELATSLLLLYTATNDEKYIRSSQKILYELLRRKNERGLFFHSYKKENIISLRDNIAVAEALIQYLKINPKNATYKNALEQLMKSIQKEFVLENGALRSFSGNNGLVAEPIIVENIKMARLFNWYAHFTNDMNYKETAKSVYVFLTHPKVAESYYTEPALLALHTEINTEPNQHVMLNVSGETNLLLNAFSQAPFFSLFYHYTKEELPEDKQPLFDGFNEDVMLICTSYYCSSPMYNAGDVKRFFIR
jgi:uncharacterized protein